MLYKRSLIWVLAVLTFLPVVSNGQNVSKVSVTPNPVSGNSSANGVVTLSKPASAAGLKVTLISTVPKIATVPASLSIAAGSTTGTFVVVTEHVPAIEHLMIEAKDPTGKTVSQALTVEPPAVRLTKLTLSPTLVPAGGSSTGTVKLAGAAPVGGFNISLASKTPAAAVPATVSVAAGATAATFTIKTVKVAATTASPITAEDGNGYAITEPFTVELPPLRLTKLTITPASVAVGAPITGLVTLSEPALKGGFVVSLFTQQTFLTIPGGVTVKQGAKTASFTFVSGAVRTQSSAVVTAADEAGYTSSGTVTVSPPAAFLSSMTVGPTAIPSGSQATCTLQLSGSAPAGGLALTLSTMQGFVTVPMTATVPAGANSVQVTLIAGALSATSTATISASDVNGYTASGPLTVIPKQTSYLVQATGGHQYLPTTITAPAGSVITWSNPDTMAHTVTSDVLSQGINSGVISKGQSFCWNIPATAKSGTTYYYHCVYHGFGGNGSKLGQGMVGAVVVK